MYACARRKTKGIVTARFYLPGPTFELTVSNNRLQKKQTYRQQQIAGIPIRSFRSVHWHEESKDKVLEALSPIGRSTKRQNTRPACGQKTDIRCAATAQGSIPSVEDTVRLLNPQPGNGRQTMQDEAAVVRYGAIASKVGTARLRYCRFQIYGIAVRHVAQTQTVGCEINPGEQLLPGKVDIRKRAIFFYSAPSPRR